MSSSYFFGPTPIYNNPVPVPGYYIPQREVVSNIVKGQATTIYVSTTHHYVVGQLVKLFVPPPWGMREINNIPSYVIDVISSEEFAIDIDSLTFSDYIQTPKYPMTTLPQVIAIGDNITGNITTTGRKSNPYPRGAFINISPLVAT
jgi:hypothetical protein